MTKAVDLSFVLNATTVNALAKNGITHIGRYLSHTSWKGLTPAEADAIKAAGLNIISIYETNPTHASYFTAAQGKSDAQAAFSLAKELNQPIGTAIYFTVDYNAQPADYAAIDAYFAAVKDNLTGYTVGAYVHYGIIGHLATTGYVKYYFQTLAWSAGKKQTFLHIYQATNDTKIANLELDEDILMQAEVGAWGQTKLASPPANTPAPAPSKSSVLGTVEVVTDNLNLRSAPNTSATIVRKLQKGDQYKYYAVQGNWYCVGTNQWAYAANGAYLKNLAASAPAPTPATAAVPFPGVIKLGSKGVDVQRVQRAVGVTPDGIFGSATEKAVKVYQSRHNLTADGQVGPKTWAVMF